MTSMIDVSHPSSSSSADKITTLHVLAASACAVALAVDMIEISIGNALSTVFSAPPYRMAATQLSWLLAAVYLGAVIGAPLLGWISDRRGVRSSLVGALVWLALTSFFAAGTDATGGLAPARFLAGLSLGAIPPLLIAYLTQIAPARHRGMFIFWVCGVAALAPPIALLGIRWLLPLQPLGVDGWRWPFVMAGVVALGAAWAFFALPELSRATRGERVAVDARQLMGTHGRRFSFVAAIYFLLPWATVGFPLLTGPILLLRGYALNEALLYAALTTVGPTAASVIAGLVVDRIERRVALGGSALIMGGAVAMFLMPDAPALMVAGALLMFGVAAAIYVTVLTLYAAEIFPGGIRVFATSSAWAINRGASAIAPIVLFPLIETHSATLSMLPICAALVASMLLIGLFGPNGAAGQEI